MAGPKSESEFSIETMHRKDWVQVKAIYAEGLATGLAAFMLAPPIWKDWHADHLKVGRLIARNQTGEVLGWAALAPVPDN